MIAFAEKTIEQKHIDRLKLICNDDLLTAKTKFLVQRRHLQVKIKRAMDILLSLVALVLASPIFLLVTIAIKLESKGPAIFKQERVGLNGKIFFMYKFRSMVIDAEEKIERVRELNETNCVMFKAKNDPRITRIGRFIRKYSLDELPQIINILKGEMSLVGPRPPLPRELKLYEPWHYVKFLGKPGLTGLWQVSGRSNIKSFDRVIGLDYHYLRNWSIWMDLAIIAKTLPVVISADGAD